MSIKSFFPIIDWLPSNQGKWFRGDVIAGIIWWLVQPLRWVGQLGAFNSILWPILGLIFQPGTTLRIVKC